MKSEDFTQEWIALRTKCPRKRQLCATVSRRFEYNICTYYGKVLNGPHLFLAHRDGLAVDTVLYWMPLKRLSMHQLAQELDPKPQTKVVKKK